jgi:HupE / UreJ protein
VNSGASQPHQRARYRPGPLLFALTLAWLHATTTVVRAHDPGLSSLNISLSDSGMSATLSLAAADVALVAGRDADVTRRVRELARDAVRIALDDERVRPVGDDVSIGPDGAHVRLSFEAPPPAGGTRRLTIESDVPSRVSRGHRVLLVVEADGRVVAERLLDATSRPVGLDLGAPSVSAPRTAWSFLTLGVHHILTGFDHLVFLLGLLLAGRATTAASTGLGARGRSATGQLVVALTAFTVAHSLSLALVVIGGIHPPSSIVEPLIAVSIAWIGIENLIRHTPRVRWTVVFAFGLIHGLGFAGGLLDLRGDGRMRDLAMGLLSFNAGVEVGQLAVAAALLPFVWLMRSRRAWEERFLPVCSGLIAVAGGYWLFERL